MRKYIRVSTNRMKLGLSKTSWKELKDNIKQLEDFLKEEEFKKINLKVVVGKSRKRKVVEKTVVLSVLTFLLLASFFDQVHKDTECSGINPIQEMSWRLNCQPIIETYEITGYSNHWRCIDRRWRDGKTATGIQVVEGVCATDPHRIPMGSYIYIKEMGFFIAADTGSAVRDRIIDLYFTEYKEAKEFGRKRKEVYVWKKMN